MLFSYSLSCSWLRFGFLDWPYPPHPCKSAFPLHLSYGLAQSEYWFWKWPGDQYVGQFHFWPNWMWSEVAKISTCFGNQWPVVCSDWDHHSLQNSGHPSLQKWVYHSCTALIVIHIVCNAMVVIVCNAEAIIARKSKNQFGRSVMGDRSAVHISCIEGDNYQK